MIKKDHISEQVKINNSHNKKKKNKKKKKKKNKKVKKNHNHNHNHNHNDNQELNSSNSSLKNKLKSIHSSTPSLLRSLSKPDLIAMESPMFHDNDIYSYEG